MTFKWFLENKNLHHHLKSFFIVWRSKYISIYCLLLCKLLLDKVVKNHNGLRVQSLRQFLYKVKVLFTITITNSNKSKRIFWYSQFSYYRLRYGAAAARRGACYLVINFCNKIMTWHTNRHSQWLKELSLDYNLFITGTKHFIL